MRFTRAEESFTGEIDEVVLLHLATHHPVDGGNARQELLSTLPRHKTYLASAHHAAGVLEGLTVMGMLPQSAV